MMGENLPALGGIVEHDAAHALARPAEKELGRRLADMRLRRTDLHVERRSRRETKRLLVVGYRADQEPPTLLELDGAKNACFLRILEGDAAVDFAVLDDFDEADWILRGDVCLELEPEHL